MSMTMKNFTLLLFVLALSCGNLMAQEEAAIGSARATTPSNMWEVTPHVGYFFVAGDVNPEFGYAGGISIRKATDYIFSLRGDFLYGKAKGANNPGNVIRNFKMNWLSGTILGVFALNSMRFDKPVRKSHIYAMAGVGGNLFEVPNYEDEVEKIRCNETNSERCKIKRELGLHAALGAGFAFRLSPRVNIGIEHQAAILFGDRADLTDGVQSTSNFRDIINYSNIRVSINLGNPQKHAEPLYWINPLQVVLDDINELKRGGAELALEDSDNDGIIDQLDKEPDTAPGALVDTKGRTLDSDRDGVPDHLDKEPYYTPREGERVNSEGIVENPVVREGVTEDRVRELIDEALQDFQPSGQGGAGSGLTDLFLPMIHFGINSTTVKYSDYGTLASIARVMKNTPDLRLVVTGFTDQTGSETYNEVLSYERAKSVVDHLVNNHGIGRGRLILRYAGQGEALVPSSSSYMNRRVELTVAQSGDVEMDPPENYESRKKSGY
jgi:OOP family OmpA-OmpF porin